MSSQDSETFKKINKDVLNELEEVINENHRLQIILKQKFENITQKSEHIKRELCSNEIQQARNSTDNNNGSVNIY
jgi:hypothetical protein